MVMLYIILLASLSRVVIPEGMPYGKIFIYLFYAVKKHYDGF